MGKNKDGDNVYCRLGQYGPIIQFGDENCTYAALEKDQSLETITLKEALCGFAFDIEHLNGKTYTINNNTGKIITPQFQKMIPQMGMKRGEQAGNLIINFKIKFPDDLTDNQRIQLSEIL